MADDKSERNHSSSEALGNCGSQFLALNLVELARILAARISSLLFFVIEIWLLQMCEDLAASGDSRWTPANFSSAAPCHNLVVDGGLIRCVVLVEF